MSDDRSKYDSTLYSMLTQHSSEVDFLNTIFQFLQRKTPCFSGPNAEDNYTVLINTLTHQRAEYRKRFSDDKEEDAAPPAAPQAPPAAKAAPPPAAKAAPAAAPKTSHDKEAEEIAAKIEKAKAGELQPEQVVDDDEAKDDKDGEEDGSKSKGSKPIGNGGVTDKFVWTQTLQELTITVPLPPGIRAKMLNVEMKQKHLRFGLKGQQPIAEGELFQKIKVEDSLWTVDGSMLVFTLSKQNAMEWWKCVFIGDPEIDTSKVEPENSQLSDLDGETRQVVEKMMFDQRAKAMGMPTSEEKKKQDMLQQFMKAHPEMDFSKAKFS